jgi:Tol biopolymer transport system component
LGLNQLVTTRRTGTPQTASEQRHLYIVSTRSEKTLRPLFPSASSTWDLLAALSHDRKTIAYTSLAPGGVPEIHLVASDGTHDRTLFSTPPPQNCPIGLRATFVGPDDTSLIVVCDLNPGDRTASRDDQVLAAFGGSDHRLYRVALDGTLIGNALASGDVAAPTVNHVGTKLVFVKDGTIDRSHSQILEVPLSDPGQITQLVSGSGLNDPAFSPVQNQLAYRQGPSQGEHIWLLKPNRQPQQLTFRGPAEGDPSWSPDGTELACTWGPYGSRGLELIDAATGQRLARFDKHGGDGPPAWTAR